MYGGIYIEQFGRREVLVVKEGSVKFGHKIWMAGVVMVLLKTGLAGGFENALYRDVLPVFTFIQQQGGDGSWAWQMQINSVFLLHGYYQEYSFGEQLWSESEGESASVQKEETVQTDGSVVSSLEAMFEEENQRAQQSLLEEAMMQEQQQHMEQQTASAEFVPHTMVQQVDLSRLQDYETLISEFYTIDSNTMAGSDQLDAVKLASMDMTISKEGDAPQILIYHTHSQEGFADSTPGDDSTTIIGVGERLAQILTEDYGYTVLHHTGKYDVDSRDDAYANSLPGIEQVLEENPSIQVIIDLHRDQMPEETKLVMDLDGRPTARFMFFNGLSRSRKTGDISYLYNQYQQENLAFSFQMKKKAEEYYPGLTRKNYLKAYRYNMHLCPKTLLIELGAQNNTVEEAMNACEPLAHILDMVLSRQ